MAELKAYKCPCCGGAISFDSSIQKLKCPYCDTEFDIEALHSLEEEGESADNGEIKFEHTSSSEWTDEDGVTAYICDSCGGSIITDETTAATSCPYCGNPVVLSGKVSGSLKPDIVIPFKLDKNAAKEALRKHMKGKALLPKVFSDENHIDEVKGVYVPFWLFDADTYSDINYRATRVRSWSDSSYIYTETRHFNIFRSGNLCFSGIPVDGSSKMPDDLMDSLEPFNLKDAVDFQTAYLAGYLADRYDVDANESVSRADERIRASVEEAFRDTVVGYRSVRLEHSKICTEKGSAKYALLPVWILNTTWRGNKYIFAMNGQTGKFVGNLPVSKGLYWKWWGIVAAAVGVGVTLISLLIGLGGAL